MHDERPVPVAARVRPVPSLPVDDLVGRSQDLARDWALALIAQLPLERIDEVPLEDLSRGAPALCAQALRALTSEADLSRLTGEIAGPRGGPAPALGLARISGAHDAAGAARAVEALRGVLWGALSIEMAAAHGRDLADTCDRLAHVCSFVLAAALQSPGPPAAGADATTSGSAAPGETAAGAGGQSRRVTAPVSAGVQIVDEHSEEPSAVISATPPGGSGEEGPQIEIRDQRSRPGPSAWIDTIGRRLEAFSRDGRPFSVLLVEPIDAVVLSRPQEPGTGGELCDELELALAGELAVAGHPHSGTHVLTREAQGRWWVLSAEPDRAGADALAARLERAACEVRDGRGRPLQVAVGTAVCPDDGREPAALAAHADVGLYAARSSARAAGRRAAATIIEGIG